MQRKRVTSQKSESCNTREEQPKLLELTTSKAIFINLDGTSQFQVLSMVASITLNKTQLCSMDIKHFFLS